MNYFTIKYHRTLTRTQGTAGTGTNREKEIIFLFHLSDGSTGVTLFWRSMAALDTVLKSWCQGRLLRDDDDHDDDHDCRYNQIKQVSDVVQ